MEAIGKETLVTKDGYQKLKDEYDHLMNVKRVEVAERIKTARDDGDITENAEYDEAKNEQARVESRLALVEERLRTAVIVSDIGTKTIGLGNVVTVADNDTGEEEVYTIVGTTEADPLAFKVSHESPVGKALMGHKKGDVVEIPVPVGTLNWEIKKIGKAKAK